MKPFSLLPVRKETKLSNYLRIPRAVLKMNLSGQALAAYALLLERAFYSQRSGYVEPDGRVYCFYPRERLAADLGCCESNVSAILRKLVAAGLIEKRLLQNGRALRFYLYVPQRDKDAADFPTGGCGNPSPFPSVFSGALREFSTGC